jgi:hypothetical protein
MNFRPKGGNYKFNKVSIDSFIEMHIEANPGTDTKQLRKDLIHFRQLKTEGVKCTCGNDIWIIGSAISGTGCFTCITKETDCSDDYEIE